MMAGRNSKVRKGKSKANPPTTRLGGRGFGATVPPRGGKLLQDARYEALYDWLRSSPHTNVKKVGIGEFDGLRGVMALQDIASGEEIVGIPATFAVNLGTESEDPLPAAQRLLATRAGEAETSPRAAYWATLPPPDSPDLCTPDFFSEKELQMLQWPPLVVETRGRSAQIRNTLGAAAPSGATSVSSLSAAGGGMRELRWAVWAVLSRVLTVQGPPNGGLGGGVTAYKLLIPFIDMFNHKAGTKHYLTGRSDGMLRVVAGSNVKAGDQIFIMYGTPATSNEEFVAHYGFHDPSSTAAAADRVLVRSCSEKVPALAFTSAEEDEALLRSDPALPYQEQLAIKLRLSLKYAAKAEGLL
jgi:hypothetical protein